MPDPSLILGVTRAKDDPRGNASGLVYREGDRLKWGALAELFPDGAPGATSFFRYIEAPGKPRVQPLERVEYTVSGTPRFLFRQTDGKLVHDELRDKLQFSEGKKALLTPQALAKPLQLAPLALEYLEISRLSDVMRKEMLGGERTQGEFAKLVAVQAGDAKLSETLWELARQRYVSIYDAGVPEENAISLVQPVPGYKG